MFSLLEYLIGRNRAASRMSFSSLSTSLNILLIITWLLQSCSHYSFREEHTYVILVAVTIVSSIISFILIQSRRRILKSQLILFLHIPSILLASYFSLLFVTNPVALIFLLAQNSDSEIRFSSPTGQTTIAFKEDCDFLECNHTTTIYSNFGIFQKSLEVHKNSKHACNIDNLGFETLKAQQANLRWSNGDKQIEWNIHGSPCIISF